MRKNNKTKGRNRNARGRSINARRLYNTKKARGLLSNILVINNRNENEEKKRKKEEKKREKEEKKREKKEKKREKKREQYTRRYGSNFSPLEGQKGFVTENIRGDKCSNESANLIKYIELIQNKHPGEGISFHIKPGRIVLLAGNNTYEYKL